MIFTFGMWLGVSFFMVGTIWWFIKLSVKVERLECLLDDKNVKVEGVRGEPGGDGDTWVARNFL